jgi:tetratricopeptide (TPR) repeat protein
MLDDLSLGLQQHQRGRLDEAARLYQQVLAARPDHDDPLHLIGVVALQQGDPARAAALIGRAVALKAGAAFYHANLADAYRALGQLDRAADCCRTALRLRPDYPEAANNLGQALLGQGKTDEAIAQFGEALRLKPDFALACSNLGNALRLRGDRNGALEHFRHAVEIDPDLAEAAGTGSTATTSSTATR